MQLAPHEAAALQALQYVMAVIEMMHNHDEQGNRIPDDPDASYSAADVVDALCGCKNAVTEALELFDNL